MFSLLSEDQQERIDNELMKDHSVLFGKYFDSEEDLNAFISSNLAMSKYNIQRRSINNVQRLVTLADELTTMKPGKCDLAIFFFLSCIESIYGFNDYKMQKQEMVIDFFGKYVSTDDQNLIRNGIMIAGENTTYDYKISMERFSLLLVSVRNIVAHEGVYWNLHFVHEEEEERTHMMHSFLAKPDKNSPPRKVLFTNKLKFSELRDILIKGYIRFIKEHESINALN